MFVLQSQHSVGLEFCLVYSLISSSTLCILPWSLLLLSWHLYFSGLRSPPAQLSLFQVNIISSQGRQESLRSSWPAHWYLWKGWNSERTPNFILFLLRSCPLPESSWSQKWLQWGECEDHYFTLTVRELTGARWVTSANCQRLRRESRWRRGWWRTDHGRDKQLWSAVCGQENYI